MPIKNALSRSSPVSSISNTTLAASSGAKSSGWPPCRNRPVVPWRRLEIRTVTNPRTLSVISRPYPISLTTSSAVACRSSSAG